MNPSRKILITISLVLVCTAVVLLDAPRKTGGNGTAMSTAAYLPTSSSPSVMVVPPVPTNTLATHRPTTPTPTSASTPVPAPLMTDEELNVLKQQLLASTSSTENANRTTTQSSANSQAWKFDLLARSKRSMTKQQFVALVREVQRQAIPPSVNVTDEKKRPTSAFNIDFQRKKKQKSGWWKPGDETRVPEDRATPTPDPPSPTTSAPESTSLAQNATSSSSSAQEPPPFVAVPKRVVPIKNTTAALQRKHRETTTSPSAVASITTKWTTHKQVAHVESECQPNWSAPRPIFLTRSDFGRWKKLPPSYGDCNFSGIAESNPRNLDPDDQDGDDGSGRGGSNEDIVAGPDEESYCTFRGGCSNYQVAYNASVKPEFLGSCGNHPFLEVNHHWAEDNGCDDRILVPLRVPQGMYLPHFHDCVLPRLSRVLLNELGFHHPSLHGSDVPKILLFIEKEYATKETKTLIQQLGFEYTQKLPKQCFRKVVWACHSIAIDAMSFQYGQRFLIEAIDRQDTQTNVSQNSSVPSSPPSPPPQDWKTCKKIYAARTKSVSNGRRVKKEDDLIQFLRSNYSNFQIVYGGESLEEWRDATRDACLLMGSHGGALTHLMFLRPENRPMVFELDGYDMVTIFWTLASALRIPYAWMSFKQWNPIDHSRVASMLQLLGELRENPARSVV